MDHIYKASHSPRKVWTSWDLNPGPPQKLKTFESLFHWATWTGIPSQGEIKALMSCNVICFSMRKQLLQKLNDSGVPAHQIVQISGHKNVNSINNYSKLNAEQSKQISNILSNLDPVSSTSTALKPVSTNSYPEYSRQTLQTHTVPTPASMFAGNTFNAPVTINFDKSMTHTQTAICSPRLGKRSPVGSPLPQRRWKRIRPMIDSDSEWSSSCSRQKDLSKDLFCWKKKLFRVFTYLFEIYQELAIVILKHYVGR